MDRELIAQTLCAARGGKNWKSLSEYGKSLLFNQADAILELMVHNED